MEMGYTINEQYLDGLGYDVDKIREFLQEERLRVRREVVAATSSDIGREALVRIRLEELDNKFYRYLCANLDKLYEPNDARGIIGVYIAHNRERLVNFLRNDVFGVNSMTVEELVERVLKDFVVVDLADEIILSGVKEYDVKNWNRDESEFGTFMAVRMAEEFRRAFDQVFSRPPLIICGEKLLSIGIGNFFGLLERFNWQPPKGGSVAEVFNNIEEVVSEQCGILVDIKYRPILFNYLMMGLRDELDRSVKKFYSITKGGEKVSLDVETTTRVEADRQNDTSWAAHTTGLCWRNVVVDTRNEGEADKFFVDLTSAFLSKDKLFEELFGEKLVKDPRIGHHAISNLVVELGLEESFGRALVSMSAGSDFHDRCRLSRIAEYLDYKNSPELKRAIIAHNLDKSSLVVELLGMILVTLLAMNDSYDGGTVLAIFYYVISGLKAVRHKYLQVKFPRLSANGVADRVVDLLLHEEKLNTILGDVCGREYDFIAAASRICREKAFQLLEDIRDSENEIADVGVEEHVEDAAAAVVAEPARPYFAGGLGIVDEVDSLLVGV